MDTTELVTTDPSNETTNPQNIVYGAAFLNAFDEDTQKKTQEVYKILMNEQEEYVRPGQTVLL